MGQEGRLGTQGAVEPAGAGGQSLLQDGSGPHFPHFWGPSQVRDARSPETERPGCTGPQALEGTGSLRLWCSLRKGFTLPQGQRDRKRQKPREIWSQCPRWVVVLHPCARVVFRLEASTLGPHRALAVQMPSWINRAGRHGLWGCGDGAQEGGSVASSSKSGSHWRRAGQ
ncbi:PREDICTED: uncharacterized protein LOC106147040 isoform X2 [Chinchilla lanigera]|uniref:uncharacterized protein LOC106147040 isoform X2 n=1 Tax=Chinchilla lanigera TaxID=34839 RepID=UPI000697BADF|nr:PREDICTED: uncharacterized protein LOC106147040 isoform X2 [Chinchilla lanigera]